MFDFSFYELVVLGIIALVVLGPEKLPQAVRKAGMYYAKFRRTVTTLKNEMEAELDLAETRQKMQEELAKIRQAEADMQKEMAQLRGNMDALRQQTSSTTSPMPSQTAKSLHQPATAPTAGHLVAGPLAAANLAKPLPPTADNAATNAGAMAATDTSVNTNSATTATTLTPPFTVDTVTRPWQNMWFLLGDYDRRRRLPPAPWLPDYSPQPLLNVRPLAPQPAALEETL